MLEQSFSANADDSSGSDETEATEINTKSNPDSELSENGEDDITEQELEESSNQAII